MDESLFCGDVVESRRILYTPSAFAKKNLIYLQETGTLTAKKPHVSKRENLSSYLFFTVVSGAGHVTYCDKEYRLSAGDCFFADCTKPYSHQSSHNLWTLKWAHFTGVNMDALYEMFAARCEKPVFFAENAGDFSALLDNLFDAANSEDLVRDIKIYELLVRLLTQIINESSRSEKSRYKSLSKIKLAELKGYIDSHYNEKISLDDLAAKFYINKYYLTRIFKKEYKTSIMAYILQKRITKAKQMLRFTDKSIGEIGIEVGLAEPYYFSRMFKQLEGVSPGTYRKSWMG